jgi:hypothetical protein
MALLPRNPGMMFLYIMLKFKGKDINPSKKAKRLSLKLLKAQKAAKQKTL